MNNPTNNSGDVAPQSYVALLLGVLLFLICPPASAAPASVSIKGQWRFALDRDDRGLAFNWCTNRFEDKIVLPGVLQSQGYGDAISTNTPWVLSLYDKLWFLRGDYKLYASPGNVKVPFVSQPPRHYLGPAWYAREIEIPAAWANQKVSLFLERPRWETRAWLDGRLCGTNDSLCVPHEFELGTLSPGKHWLAVRVDNRMLMNYRPDAHAVSDSLGSTWNGITGDLELRSRPNLSIRHVRLTPSLQNRNVQVRLTVVNDAASTIENVPIELRAWLHNEKGRSPVVMQTRSNIKPGESTVDLFYPMGNDFREWSEFQPAFYRFRASLSLPDSKTAAFETVFGMREVTHQDKTLLINGVPTFLRGTHHGGDFPLTGYPPSDADYWRELFKTCRDWGMNHVRFHSFCPPEAAFSAADEIGIYLQIEPGMWNEISPNTPMERMLYAETERILNSYGNHPSFVLMSASNEPKGNWKRSLPLWVEHFRSIDPRMIYTTGTGWSLIDQPGPVTGADYLAVHRIGLNMLRGDRGWFGRDYANSLRGVNVPVVAHESGQWCAYPDFSVIRDFKGYARPGNYEIFRDSARASGVLQFNEEFARASVKFQLACYKEEIEANTRTEGLSGYQLLDLHDYTGQGTALVGVLDPFWKPKNGVTLKEWRSFVGPVTPLARLARRTFVNSDTLSASIDIANFTQAHLTNVAVVWEIADSKGRAVLSGRTNAPRIMIGRLPNVLTAQADLSRLPAPAAYKLVAKVSSGALAAENDWNFWLYPSANTAQADLAEKAPIVTSWPEAEQRLARGEAVLFVPRKSDMFWDSPPLDNRPVFWNRLMNPQWGRMLGLWCDNKHPALAAFPTEENCDWQWTELTQGARALNIGRLNPDLKPIVAAVDDWNRNWKLAPIFEAKAGKGRLLVCSFDILSSLDQRPAARQLRQSLVDYVGSSGFKPRVEVALEELRSLWFDTLVMRKLGAKAQAQGSDASAAIDGDPNTVWVAGAPVRGRSSGAQHPHSLLIEFPKAVEVRGLELMNRQNDRDHLGDIREYVVEITAEGKNWQQVAAGALASTWRPQSISFNATLPCKALRFHAKSGFGKDPSAALAEIAVQYAGAPLPEIDASLDYKKARSTSSDVDEGQ